MTFANRKRVAGGLKWMLAAAIVTVIGNTIDLYITYQDMVNPNYWGTVAVYGMLIACIRKVIR